MNAAPSLTPSSQPPRWMTWPMVAYAFVRELPYVTIVVGGTAVAMTLVFRSPGSLEPIAAVVFPAMLTVLGKSRPADSKFDARAQGG
jgi:hypothetical protein